MLQMKGTPPAVMPMLSLLVLNALQIKDMEALMDNKAAWDALSRREQQEKEGVLRQESECACTLHVCKHVGQMLWASCVFCLACYRSM